MQKGDQTMSSEDKKHRSHLPIPSPERTGLITYDARDPDAKFPPIEQLRPPKGAPNVLLILIDARRRATMCCRSTTGLSRR
jgi:arylsulfatase